MRGHHHLEEIGGAAASPFAIIAVGVILIAIAVIVVYYFLIWGKRRVQAAGESKDQSEIEAQVYTLIEQNGGAIEQTEISSQMGFSFEVVSSILYKLEQEGFIKRIWKKDRSTFMVTNHAE